MSSVLRLYLIRHGETQWTLSRRHTGRTDIRLTSRGEEEAREAGRFLRGTSFMHIFTSPRLRARRTCELANLGPLAQIDADLAEWDYGDYEGRTTQDIQRMVPDWNLFRCGGPNGEDPAQVLARTDRLFARLRAMTGNVALFTHGQFSGVLAARWIGLPVVHAEHFPLGTASVGILSFAANHPSMPVIEQWNGRTSLPVVDLGADRPIPRLCAGLGITETLRSLRGLVAAHDTGQASD